jgi:hypothetical protein
MEGDGGESKKSESMRSPVHDQKKRDTIKGSLARLLVTFANAKLDYDATAEADVVAKSSAVKFLRDTAENALNYLRSWKIDHYMVPELEASFAMAKEKAIVLSGGRKRPFEIGDEGARSGRRSTKHPQQCRRRRTQADCYRPS